MDLPVPAPAPNELLVRVEFAGMNPFDWKIADGLLDGSRPHVFPLVLGVDAAGVVEVVGARVRRFRPGDRVVGQFLHDPVGTGTYAERAPVPEGIGIVRVPDDLPSAEAAALPTAGMTALAGVDALGLSPDAALVIAGASGGVGSFATEIATSRGIRVIALGRAASASRLKLLGAIEVVDPTDPEAITDVARAHPNGVDGLLDAMSGPAGFARFATLVHRGGSAWSTTFAADVEALKGAGVRGGNLNLIPNAALMERLVREVVGRDLTVPLERRVPLSEAPSALAESKAGRSHGKTVVEPGA